MSRFFSNYDSWKLATPPEYEEEELDDQDEYEPEYEYEDRLEPCNCYGCATMRHPCVKDSR